MIDNMVELLKKEGADDEKQKEWCDAELAKSADDKTAATEEGEMLDSSVEEITDTIKTAETDISTLSLEIQGQDGRDGGGGDVGQQRRGDHGRHQDRGDGHLP